MFGTFCSTRCRKKMRNWSQNYSPPIPPIRIPFFWIQDLLSKVSWLSDFSVFLPIGLIGFHGMSKRGWISIHVCDDLATFKNGVRRDCICKRAVNPGVIIEAVRSLHVQNTFMCLQISKETGVRLLLLLLLLLLLFLFLLLLLLLLFIIKQNWGKDGGTVEK